jgi:predicted HD phosphohydrolase
MTDTAKRVSFKSFAESTQEDWDIIMAARPAFIEALPGQLLAHLQLLRGESNGFPVDRLEHTLQTTTRAARAGKDDEYLFCALFHDVGDILAPDNHAGLAAALVRPYVSEANVWMVEQHALFQGYQYFHYIRADRNMRDQYMGHPYYEQTLEFCEEFDQSSFDATYASMALEEFESLVRDIVLRKTGSKRAVDRSLPHGEIV